MKGFALLAALAAVTSSVSAAQRDNTTITHFVDPYSKETIRHFHCGTHKGHASAHFNKTVETLHRNHKHSHVGTRAAKHPHRKHKKQSPTAINAYFHVITGSNDTGTITQAMATAQAQELNNAYNQYGFSFTLQNTSFTTNDAWAQAADDADMTALQQALRVGTYSDINIYFHSQFAGGQLGTCSLPSQVEPGTPPSMYYSDGCSVNANTMPGGTMTGYNLGKTAVHETGHWLGLLHTFEGYACTGDGDYIADTPMESQSTSGCPVSPLKNSCPSVSSGDPITNYMDYSTDACYAQFTQDQVARMDSMWAQYRQGN